MLTPEEKKQELIWKVKAVKNAVLTYGAWLAVVITLLIVGSALESILKPLLVAVKVTP